MDGNPIALVDPLGANTGGGEGDDSNMLGEVVVTAKMPERNFQGAINGLKSNDTKICIDDINLAIEIGIGDKTFKTPKSYPNFNKTMEAIGKAGYLAASVTLYPVNKDTGEEMNAGQTKEYYDETKRVPMNERPSEAIRSIIGDEKGKFLFGAGPGQGFHTIIITYDNTGDDPIYGIGDQGTGWTNGKDGYVTLSDKNSFDKKILSMILRAAVLYTSGDPDGRWKPTPTASVKTTLILIKPMQIAKLKSLGVESIKLKSNEN